MTDNENEVDEDYEAARNYYYNILEKGEEGLENMLDLAKDSDHPRTWEVFAGLMKANSDVADRLMELQKKKREVRNADQAQLPPGSTNNTQNNIYVGSTTDLQRMIHDKKKSGPKTIDQDDDDGEDDGE